MRPHRSPPPRPAASGIPRSAILFLLAICVVAMAPALFLGRVPAQTDWLAAYGPWGEAPWTPKGANIFNPGCGDDFFVYLPDRIAAINEWRAGRIPLWNPYVSGGVSFLGMQTSNPLDPLILLELLLPMGFALGLAYGLLLFLTGLGIILYLRDRGLRNRGALAIAAISFALGPYFVMWLENRVFLAGLATLPLGLWALERLLTRAVPGRREAAVLALAIGFASLAGTLQTLAIFLMVLLVRLAWVLVSGRPAAGDEPGDGAAAGRIPGAAGAAAGGRGVPGRRLVLPALAAAAGIAIGILPILAGIEMLSQSTRLGTEGYYVGRNFLHWRAIALWFSPGVFRLPAEGEVTAFRYLGRMFMSGSGWGALGVVPLGLAMFALVRRAGPARERGFWGVLGGATLAFLLLQATPVHAALTRVLPWLDDVDLLRGLVVVNLAGAILAGWGAADLAEMWTRQADRRKWIIAFLVFLAFGAAAVVAGRSGLPPAHALPVDLLPLLVPLAGVLAVGLLPLPGRRVWLLAAVVTAELLWMHFRLNTFAPPDLTFPQHPLTVDLAKFLNVPGRPRYLVQENLRLFPPNTGSVYGLPDVRGYSNIPIARYRLLLECAEGRRDLRNLPILKNVKSPVYDLLGASHVLAHAAPGPDYVPVWKWGVYRRPRAYARAFLVHDVKVVDGEPEMRAALSDSTFQPANGILLESAAGPAPPTSPPTGNEVARISSWEADRVAVHVEVTSDAVLVLADPWFPGWHATLDGDAARIYPAYWGLRAVAVGPGTHEVIFTYHPSWLIPGAVTTAAGLFFAFAGLAVTRKTRVPGAAKSPGKTR